MSRPSLNSHRFPGAMDGVTLKSVDELIPADLLAWKPEAATFLAWSGVPDYRFQCSIPNLEELLRSIEQVVRIERSRQYQN